MEALEATEFFDWETPIVKNFAIRAAGSAGNAVDRAVRLFYAVRDGIRYEIYGADLSRTSMKASSILRSRRGFCIHKSIVFCAASRAVGIPSRLALSDVRNHLCTERLRRLIGGDVFYQHAFSEVLLNGRWVKATPVFDKGICALFGIRPLEFDGEEDSILHPFDESGQKYMEFLRHHGSFSEFPYEMCVGELKRHYPRLFREAQQIVPGRLERERRRELEGRRNRGRH